MTRWSVCHNFCGTESLVSSWFKTFSSCICVWVCKYIHLHTYIWNQDSKLGTTIQDSPRVRKTDTFIVFNFFPYSVTHLKLHLLLHTFDLLVRLLAHLGHQRFHCSNVYIRSLHNLDNTLHAVTDKSGNGRYVGVEMNLGDKVWWGREKNRSELQR